MMKKNKIATKVACAAVIGCLGAVSIGGMLAYFTDSSSATNTFTVGDSDSISAEVVEANWDETEATDITPNAEFSKDPEVTNTGDMDLYAYVTVEVPYANVSVDGAAAADTELFSYEINDGWVELTDYSTTDTSAGTVTHVYAYVGDDSSTLEALASGSSTGTLFDTIKFANVASNQGLEGTSLDVVVTGYAIQTTYLNDTTNDGADTGTDDPATVWEILLAQAV